MLFTYVPFGARNDPAGNEAMPVTQHSMNKSFEIFIIPALSVLPKFTEN